MKRLVLPIVLAALLAGAAVYLYLSGQAAAPATGGGVPGAPAAAEAGGDGAQPGRKPSRVIPAVLPDFALATPEGPLRKLSSFQHPSLIVNFWATWCAPCRREIPLLRQLRNERGARGVERARKLDSTTQGEALLRCKVERHRVHQVRCVNRYLDEDVEHVGRHPIDGHKA